MKLGLHQLWFSRYLSVVILLAALAARTAASQTVFLALLEQGQEVSSPNVDTPLGDMPYSPPAGRGFFFFDPRTGQLSYEVKMETTLVGTMRSADVHAGEIGKTGPLLFSLERGTDGFEGTSPVLTTTQKRALMQSELYVSVKTSAKPARLRPSHDPAPFAIESHRELRDGSAPRPAPGSRTSFTSSVDTIWSRRSTAR